MDKELCNYYSFDYMSTGERNLLLSLMNRNSLVNIGMVLVEENDEYDLYQPCNLSEEEYEEDICDVDLNPVTISTTPKTI